MAIENGSQLVELHQRIAELEHLVAARDQQNLDIQARLEEQDRFFDMSRDLLSITAAGGHMRRLNPAWEQTLGFTLEELMAEPLMNFVHPEDRDATLAIANQILAGQYRFTYENRYRCKDGLYKWFHWIGTYYPDTRQVFAVARDITERKATEAALRKSEASLASAQRIAHLGNWELDLQTHELYWSDEVYRIFGLTPQEFGATQDAFFERVHADDRDALLQVFEEAIEQNKLFSYEHRIIRPNGEVRVVQEQGEIVCDAAGAPVRVLGTLQEITERKRAEEEQVRLREEIIRTQDTILRELSTPLIPINEQVMVMPLIGTLDDRRAQQVLETLLEGIVAHQADVAILDITGVSMVDTQVANALIRTAQAVKLLGTQMVLTGIGAEVAQSLVGLGVDLTNIVTRSTLQSGIAYAMGQG